jgi:hypothetical protein
MAILKGSPIFHFRFSPKEEWVPLAVSSSTDATPIFCPVLKSAGWSTTFALRRILQPLSGGRVCTGKWSRMIVNLSLCSARWILCKKKGIPECILFVTQRITNIGYSSIRSSRRSGSRRRNLLHSSNSSASSRFHFHSTLLKKEMDNELAVVFSSDLEEHSHHKKLKKKSDLLSSNGSVWRYSARVRRCGGQLLFFASTG